MGMFLFYDFMDILKKFYENICHLDLGNTESCFIFNMGKCDYSLSSVIL